jgi:hypothetical protein
VQFRFVPGVPLVKTEVLQYLTSVGKKIYPPTYLQVRNRFIARYLTLDDVRNEGNRLLLRAGTQTFEV